MFFLFDALGSMLPTEPLKQSPGSVPPTEPLKQSPDSVVPTEPLKQHPVSNESKLLILLHFLAIVICFFSIMQIPLCIEKPE